MQIYAGLLLKRNLEIQGFEKIFALAFDGKGEKARKHACPSRGSVRLACLDLCMSTQTARDAMPGLRGITSELYTILYIRARHAYMCPRLHACTDTLACTRVYKHTLAHTHACKHMQLAVGCEDCKLRILDAASLDVLHEARNSSARTHAPTQMHACTRTALHPNAQMHRRTDARTHTVRCTRTHARSLACKQARVHRHTHACAGEGEGGY